MMSTHPVCQRKTTKSFLALIVSAFFIYGYNNAFMVATPLLLADMGGTATAAGLQATLFIIAAIVLRFFFGPFADKHGRKLTMYIGAGAFLLAAILLLAANAVWQVFLLRIVQAVGLAAYFPSASATAAACADHSKRGTYIGILRMVASLSLMILPALSFFLIKNYDFPVFLRTMAFAAALGIAAVSLISPNTDQSRTPATGQHEPATLSLLKKSRFLIGITFASALSYGILMSFASSYIGKANGNLQPGLYFTLFSLGGIAANGTFGWLSDRFGPLKLTVSGLFILGSGFILFSFLLQNSYVFYPAALLGGIGYYGSIAVLMAWLAEQSGSQERTTALALQQNGLDLGIAAGSGAFGILLTWGWNDAVLYKILGGFYVCYALINYKKFNIEKNSSHIAR